MLQVLIQGLLLSGLYALIAVGFTLIFSVGRVLNLAYGAYLLIGGYVYFHFAQTLGLPKFAGVALAGIFGCAMGVLKYQLLVKPLKGNHVAIEISSLILAVFLQYAVVFAFGDSSKILLPIIPGVERVAGAAIPYSNLFAAIASWIILIALWAYVRFTHMGRAMQAVSMDAKGAAISGIDANRVNMTTWAISGTLGAIAGVFFASYTQLYPGMWVAPLIVAVAVVIVGGIGSIMGTLLVAHIIGFLEVLTSSLIAPELRGVFTMVLIIAILVLRPQGLLGREEL
ncbi:MAG: branched-chain amino acid ABC transporter permease [Ahrensia sp.]|nr:branched-chain amino acid ABC transporter permease [Ahrensia sp.]